MKSKWVSLLLCIFFGWLGVHRFYERKIPTGILYLFTLGIFGIGWIHDIWLLLIKPNKPITESPQYNTYLATAEALLKNGYTIEELTRDWCLIRATVKRESVYCGEIFVIADPTPGFVSYMLGVFPKYENHRYEMTEYGSWKRRLEIVEDDYKRSGYDFSPCYYWPDDSFIAGVAGMSRPTDDNEWLKILDSTSKLKMEDRKLNAEYEKTLQTNQGYKYAHFETEETKKEKRKNLIIIIIVCLISAPLGWFLMDFLTSKPKTTVTQEVQEEPESQITATQGSFTDPRDGKTYKTAKINAQTWLAENLSYNAKGGNCYGNEPENCDSHGRLYNWATAMKVCPDGWHLPTNEEWDKLYRSIDGNSGAESPYKSETAGKHLKAASGWKDFQGASGNGTDKYGFAFLPGGSGNPKGKTFQFLGEIGYWWSSSENTATNAYYRFMSRENDNAGFSSSASKEFFLSVRCLQD